MRTATRPSAGPSSSNSRCPKAEPRHHRSGRDPDGVRRNRAMAAAEGSTMSDDAAGNFAGLVEAACARAPGRPALLHGNEVISYGELARRIDAFAGALRGRGVGPGRSVAIWLPNCPAFVEAFFAALRLGATVAPLGALLRPREVRERLQIADPTVLVTTAALADAL